MLKSRSCDLGLNVLFSVVYDWNRERATILLKTNRGIDLPLDVVIDPFITDFSFISGWDLYAGLYYHVSEELPL